ncbi:hypothetical protein [Caballeronia sp. CLC5]|uniref:hypothetical protein n=1 Tax=Caballeronia sp. CLC5 TaxID=2906764 RepID=UPI001F33DA12|nr:hypothetical protein [Caballeronia sp. CLC5]MCE4574332.1 hypothetical protein [Caballeronia sp. CLC5]
MQRVLALRANERLPRMKAHQPGLRTEQIHLRQRRVRIVILRIDEKRFRKALDRTVAIVAAVRMDDAPLQTDSHVVRISCDPARALVQGKTRFIRAGEKIRHLDGVVYLVGLEIHRLAPSRQRLIALTSLPC